MKKTSMVKRSIDEFREALMAGIEGIVRASEIYVEAIDDDPRAADSFREELSEWVPASAWAQFEAVGRKWMHPRLIMGGMTDRKKASLIKKLPYSMQDRVFKKHRFDLLLPGGDHIKVDMMESTAKQAEQLCNGTAIRSLSEQKAWLEARAVLDDEKPELLPYTICGGKVSFRRGVTMNRSELKRLLQEM